MYINILMFDKIQATKFDWNTKFLKMNITSISLIIYNIDSSVR